MPTRYADFSRVASAEAGLTPEQFNAALAASLPPLPEVTAAERCERVWAESQPTVWVRAAQVIGRRFAVAVS